MQPNRLSHAALSLAIRFALISFSTLAYAQNTTGTDGAEEDEATELESVTITGSRIKRAGFDTLEPATTLTRAEIDLRGQTNVADSLNQLPGFGIGVTPEGGQASFGAGVNFVNRFGLGTNRTLTLVNGRRFVSSNPPSIFGAGAPGLQVDLNAIPTQLIERVENLAVGGAPTYGSDAIAGTVNVILRQDYEGFEVGSTVGATEEGENFRYNARALYGFNFADDRGNVVVSASMDDSEGVLQSDIEFFTRNRFFGVNPLETALGLQPGRTPLNDGRLTGIPFNTGPADGIPNAVLAANRRLMPLTFGGLLFPATGATTLSGGGGLPRGFGGNEQTYLQFDQNGNLVPYNPGTPFGTLDASGGDGLNLTETAQVTSDLRRANLFGSGHFNIGESSRLYFEALYFTSEAQEIIDQSIYNATIFGGLSQPLTFQATDPRLTQQARTRLQELGISSFRLSRASRDLVNNNARTETELMRGVLGFATSFAWGDQDFTWDTSLTYGRSDADNFQTVLDQQRFVNAINVTTNAAGQVVCDPNGRIGVFTGPTPVADSSCVPLDIFGEGRASEAARNYVTARTRANSTIEQSVFNSNIGSYFFDYWAGSIGVNVGYEHRTEQGRFTPDPFQVAGRGRAVPIGANGGKFDTHEFFGEASIPLIGPSQEIFGVDSLDIELKGRNVDNSINGSFDAYTYGFQWSPFSDLRIRGNRTRSLRAPAIVELFTPLSTGFLTLNDPCDGRFIGAPGSTRFENCQALFRNLGLVGAGETLTNFQSTIVSATQQGVTGGDPNLDNERSIGRTIGFVYEPGWVPGLSVALDYIEIDIADSIVTLTGTQIANACFDDPNFDRNNPRAGNRFCTAINRNGAGQIVETRDANGVSTPAIRTGYANIASTDFRGVTSEAAYRFETDKGWKWTIAGSAFNLRELSNQVLGIRTFTDGVFGNARQQYQLRSSVDIDRWNFNAQANYLGGVAYNNAFTAETQDILRVGSHTTLDLGLGYRFDQGLVRLSVTNATDREPPFGTTAGAAIGAYDILGRRYALSAEWKF